MEPLAWNSCTCRIRMLSPTGELLTVKSRKWDCPSCGRDKAKKIREMVVTANVERMWTLTLPQPHYNDQNPDDQPEDFRDCDELTHVYLYRDGSPRWRYLEECANCQRNVGKKLDAFRKRVRRAYPGFQYLWIKEVKPRSGAFDVNLVAVGVPVVTRHNNAGRRIKAAWRELGGGFVDLGTPSPKHSPGAVGRYIGKYLTKYASRPMARHYRRWGRSRGFAPGIRMAEQRPKPEHDLLLMRNTGELIADSGPGWNFAGWVDIDGWRLLPPGYRRWPGDCGEDPETSLRVTANAAT